MLKALLAALVVATAAHPDAASAAHLEPFSHTYSVVAIVNGKAAVTSQWRDTLDQITVAGRRALRRTQVSMQSNGKSRTWVSVFEPDTLKPIGDTFNTSDGDIFARTFADGIATDYSSNAVRGILVTTTTRLPAEYSDFNGGQFGLALLSLPLAPGYTTTLTAFGSTDASIQSIPVRVLRTEQIQIRGRAVEAVVVKATFAAKYYPDEGENYMTFWLTRDLPYVARLIMEAPQQHLHVEFNLEA